MSKSKRKKRKYEKSKLKNPKLRIPTSKGTEVHKSGKLYNRRRMKRLMRILEE